jgi:hypothetical protein
MPMVVKRGKKQTFLQMVARKRIKGTLTEGED